MAKTGGGAGRIASSFSADKARYAKGKVAVRPRDSSGGFKGEASYLAQGLGGKWSSRERAYIMSPSAAARLPRLMRRRITYSPFSETFRYSKSGRELSRQEIMRM